MLDLLFKKVKIVVPYRTLYLYSQFSTKKTRMFCKTGYFVEMKTSQICSVKPYLCTSQYAEDTMIAKRRLGGDF
jgi:hypothetical protein